MNCSGKTEYQLSLASVLSVRSYFFYSIERFKCLDKVLLYIEFCAEPAQREAAEAAGAAEFAALDDAALRTGVAMAADAGADAARDAELAAALAAGAAAPNSPPPGG